MTIPAHRPDREGRIVTTYRHVASDAMPDVKRVLECVERHDLACLLDLCPLEEIADSWWRYTLRWDAARKDGLPEPNQYADPDGWAEQVWLSEVLDQREEAVRELLRLMAERAPAGADLGYLGAGPIEDFVTNESRLSWIETEAARSPAFRGALASTPGRACQKDRTQGSSEQPSPTRRERSRS